MKDFTLKKLMLIVTLLTTLNAFAYDIQIDNIYYYVNVNDFTCEVTYKDANYNSYSGDIVIPETVTYKTKTLRVTGIGYRAFYNCTDLTSVTIGKSVSIIKEDAFMDCSGLESITIPNSVTRIDNYAFSGCSSLKELTLEDGTSSLSLGYCPYSYTFEGWTTNQSCGLFRFCPIENVYIGRDISCEQSPFYDTLNEGNPNIKSVTFGNTVTKIRYNAFYKCSNLTSLTIGNSVNKIEDDAFEGCPNLVSIYLEGTIPPIVEGDNFTKRHYMDATVYVPQGSLSTYQSADIWKNFWDIREEGTTEIPEEEVKKCATPVITYSNSGLDITSETDGAEIHTDITCSDANSYNGDRIDLSAKYTITTYATKQEFQNSEAVTATLYWIAVSSDEGVTDVFEVEAMPVLVTCSNGTINICGGKEGAEVVVYTTSGVAVGNAIITNGNVAVSTGLAKGEIAVVNIAGKGIKIVMQ